VVRSASGCRGKSFFSPFFPELHGVQFRIKSPPPFRVPPFPPMSARSKNRHAILSLRKFTGLTVDPHDAQKHPPPLPAAAEPLPSLWFLPQTVLSPISSYRFSGAPTPCLVDLLRGFSLMASRLFFLRNEAHSHVFFRCVAGGRQENFLS